MNAPRIPIRVGLVGYGYAGKTFHAPLIAATDGMALTVVASSDATRVRQDLPTVEVVVEPSRLLLHDAVDLVVLATPNASHAPLASAALRAGKHVVVDKPFTLDLAEARQLLQLAHASGRLLSVFHNRRWDSDFLAVRQAIADGAVGQVTHFESHIDRYRPTVRARWREQAVPGAGICYDLGPHLIDQALQLFGLPARIHASLAIQRPGGMVDDWAHLLLDYGSTRVVLHASMLVAGGVARFTVHGSRGSLVKLTADRQEAQLLAGMTPGAVGWGEDPDPLTVYDDTGTARQLPVAAGDYRHYYRGIGAALAGRAANPVTPLEALAVMAVLEAALEADRTGRSMALPLTEAERISWQQQTGATAAG